MARESNESRLKTIHAEALAEFDEIQKAVSDERMQCLEDRRFYSIAGAPWEGQLGDQFANRPRFEFNKVHLSVMRIISEYRNNRIDVDFTPKDGATNSDLADVCDGLYRADQQDCGGQEATDNAFEEAVGGGFGAVRLRCAYEDEDDDENERQRVRLEPIYDADSSVFFDLGAKRQDKADARRCFVLTAMAPAVAEEEFGHNFASWDKAVSRAEFDWCTPDVVYVAEYYRVEETSEVVHIFRGLDDVDMRVPDHEFKEDETKLETLLATGFRKTGEKRIKSRRVHKYILSGLKIEEDEGYIAGKCIPIVPMYGKRWVVDNVERCMGHVRLAKDAQRLMNSLLSWLFDMAARFDVEKPIMTPEQIAGHTEQWADDNVRRYPYLLANLLKDADGNPIPGSQAPVAYTRAPNVPPAMAALIQIAGQSLDELLGSQQAGEQVVANVSAKAVELVQNRLDMQTFIYMSNAAKMFKRIGEVWLSMAREVMVEDGRKAKTVTSDGSIDTVTLRQPMVNDDGEQYTANDLTEASFDVWVDVGPSSGTQRSGTVRALTGMASITTDPQQKSVLMAAAMMNMEGDGLVEVRDWFRQQLVRQGVVKPTDDELAAMQKEQQGKQPGPQDQYMLAAAEEAQANAAQSRAKTVDTIAAADLKRAQTQKTLSETAGQPHAETLATIEVLQRLLDAQHRQQGPRGLPGMQ